ncbi:glycosyltransferase family protein [Microbacterium sp. MAHUQ-60]|uniref:glycosyltransferase family protein n=1 Tax=unclassified Microbacterium TaxID=2609290 RepID=UPI00361C59EF
MSSVVFLSHTARSGDFRVGSHHLSRELAAQGHTVAHISTPFSLTHAALKPQQRTRRTAAFAGPVLTAGVTDFIPTPLFPANFRWTKTQTTRALKRVGIPRPDFVFIDQPLFPSTHFPSSTVVFRPTDIFRSSALTRAARGAALYADAVAATSPKVLASVLGDSSRPNIVLENGVEYARFANAQANDKQYDFVYVGALDFRFDFEALSFAARALPGSEFAIFGPMPGRLPPFPPNVQFKGPIGYECVPTAIARGRIGLMPFVDNESNAARSPMKLYEYIATGVPVIAPQSIVERSPGIRALIPFTAGDSSSFAQALAETLLNNAPIGDVDREVARSKDWSVVAAELLGFAKHVSGGKGEA